VGAAQHQRLPDRQPRALGEAHPGAPIDVRAGGDDERLARPGQGRPGGHPDVDVPRGVLAAHVVGDGAARLDDLQGGAGVDGDVELDPVAGEQQRPLRDQAEPRAPGVVVGEDGAHGRHGGVGPGDRGPHPAPCPTDAG
jgi:hypothetical protein